MWNKDPLGILELGKLVKLEIIKCGLSKIPLSTALVENLVLLEKLKIESCEIIEQVVEDDPAEIREPSFPKLKYLQLVSLLKLVKFNAGHHNFRFPNLLNLRIEKCPNLNEMMQAYPNKLQKLKLAGVKMLDNIWQGGDEYSGIPLWDLQAMEVDSYNRLTICGLQRQKIWRN